MNSTSHQIDHVEQGSIADQLGIQAGDELMSINGEQLRDVFDYHFLINDTELQVEIRRQDGTLQEYEVEKDYYEDLGLVFDNGLMDDYRSCTNKCIFCFIDQMPPGMRETLYFKDDDSRLSFLQGNYVTLTNMTDEDVERIIRYKMAPINISVHTVDPQLRCKMLNNRFAGEALDKIRLFYEAGIEMNAQVVLCHGINDGKKLEETIEKMVSYLPHMRSMSIVPVGLTKYRENLYHLKPITKKDAAAVLNTVRKWQSYCQEHYGTHFVHASDEFYLLAEEDFPDEDVYDGYPQLENGVGMMPLLESEFMDCLREDQPKKKRLKVPFFRRKREEELLKTKTVSIATGLLAAPLLRKLTILFSLKYPEVKVNIYEIKNYFFGERITVSGLITGRDLRTQLRRKDLGLCLLLPCNMMRSGEEVFLDDMTRQELEDVLHVPVRIVGSSGQDLFDKLKEIADE